MATEDDTQSEMTNTEAMLSTSSDKVAQIRDLLSRAVRTKRSQQAGDLMPVVGYLLYIYIYIYIYIIHIYLFQNM